MIIMIIIWGISWLPIVYQPINDFISSYIPSLQNINWLAIISGLVFAGFTFWVIFDLYRKIGRLENDKPNIKVSTLEENRTAYLKVANNGASDTFMAQIEIATDDHNIDISKRKYLGYWKLECSNKAILRSGLADLIKIAEFISNPPYITKCLHFYYYDEATNKLRPETNGECYFPSTAWTSQLSIRDSAGNQRELWKPEYQLIVTISSDKGLLNGEFIGQYKLDLDHFTEIKTNQPT